LGGVEWFGPAYDPIDRMLFVNTVDRCATFKMEEDQASGTPWGGDMVLDPPNSARGWLRAFDAATGAERWAYQAHGPMLAGITPTASGLILTGSGDGEFLVFDSRTGRKLYRFYTGGAIAGGISTYTVAGKQYIAVPSGNSSKSLWDNTGGAMLIIFGLPVATKTVMQ
jgi:alcohol dehydrogenase (cytochrome c)